MINIDYKFFFDRPAVQKKVKDGVQSVLARMGAFVRTRAQRSIRPAPKKHFIPVAGQPPRSHVGTLRDLIFFGYDTSTETMVVGPKLFKSGKPTAPNLLEFGGSTINSKGKRATYRKFPFMNPALIAESANFPGLFSGSIKG
jgi:hypothetical protein